MSRVASALAFAIVLSAVSVHSAEPDAAVVRRVRLAPATMIAEVLDLKEAGPTATVQVDALGKTIRIETSNGKKAAAALRKQRPAICPDIRVDAKGMTLTCVTSFLHVTWDRRTLEVRQLRGLPFEASEQNVPIHYETSIDACPGARPIEKAECALRAGELQTAEAALTEALGGIDAELAKVRMGDLWLMRGDPTGAVNWWMRASGSGVMTRVSRVRTCEVSGVCFGTPAESKTYDLAGVPEPYRTEIFLRGVRVDAFFERLPEALGRLRDALERGESACRDATVFCRTLALHGLKSESLEEKQQAVALYFALPNREEGPLALDLLAAVADAARSFGAPIYAANLLSAVTPRIPRDRLEAHLMKTITLFIEGNDRERARFIYEYAETKLGPKTLAQRQWKQLFKSLTHAPKNSVAAPSTSGAGAIGAMPSPEAVPDVERARDVARAVLEKSRELTDAAAKEKQKR